MITDTELLDFLIELEAISLARDRASTEGSSSSLTFTQQQTTLEIHSSWTTYEEGGSTELIVNLATMEVQYDEAASTVYGAYDNVSIKKIKTLQDILEML